LYIEELRLLNFRNYEKTMLRFSEGTNLILGKNGDGKTNLLEAVYMLSTSKSFRIKSDQKVSRWGTESYSINGIFRGDGKDIEITLCWEKGVKTLYINKLKEEKVSSIIGHVYCVLFYFDDIYLITGPPQVRRNYMDLILSTVDRLYFNNLKTYLGVLKQKNKYLREVISPDRILLETWNEQLVEAGNYIVKKRMQLIDFINSYIVQSKNDIENLVFPFQVVYRTNLDGVEKSIHPEDIRLSFKKTLERGIQKEIETKQSIYGPQRDDFLFTDDKFEVRYFGSIGEARLSSILLKLAQAYFYTVVRDVIPILLVDDILLELDEQNMNRMMKLMGSGNQKLITTTEMKKLPSNFLCEKVFQISEKGKISCRKIGSQN